VKACEASPASIFGRSMLKVGGQVVVAVAKAAVVEEQLINIPVGQASAEGHQVMADRSGDRYVARSDRRQLLQLALDAVVGPVVDGRVEGDVRRRPPAEGQRVGALGGVDVDVLNL